MGSTTYKDLIVWQKSMLVAKGIYALVKKLPKEEIYALSDQMRRAAVSIPSNIAEGYGRISHKEYAHFLSIAKGSASELTTQLELCVMIGYLTDEDIHESLTLLDEIERMLHCMIRKFLSTSTKNSH